MNIINTINTINNDSINPIASNGPESLSDEHYTQTYITLDQDELSALGVPRELWDDIEVINDSIHSAIHNLVCGLSH